MFLIVMIGVMGIATAALVPYLSNIVTGTATADSPIALSAADDASSTTEDWGDATDVLPADSDFTKEDGSLDLSVLYGGEGEGFWIKVENLASVPVEDDLVFEIYCDEGIEMDGTNIGDFDATMNVYDWIDGEQIITNPQDVETLLGSGDLKYELSENKKTLRIWDEDSYLYEAGVNGDEYYVFVDMDFELNAHGSYTIRAAFMEDPMGEFPAI